MNSSTSQSTTHKLQAISYKRVSAHGFTLIEILLVVGITALLAGAGALSLTGLRRATSIESEVKSISSVLRSAQERAINQDQQSRWGVYFDNPAGDGGDTYALYKVDETLLASSTYFEIPGEVNDRRAIRGGLRYTSPADATSTNVVFNKLSGRAVDRATINIEFVSGGTASGTGSILILQNGTIGYPLSY